jgi:polysaccharide export outer membrane protein
MNMQTQLDASDRVTPPPPAAGQEPPSPPAKHRLWWAGVALLALVWLVASCQSTRTPAPGEASRSAPPGAPGFSSLRLMEGDAVRVNFEGASNLNTIVKLQLDGSITLPLVGEVKALRKTPQELQAELVKLYEKMLQPGYEISVSVAATAASVYVSGAVLRPGRIPMERPLTVLDAIMEAGGFDLARAKPSKARVLRVADGVQRHYDLNLKQALKGDDSSVFYLQPFDIVHVPEKTFNF